ncbi:unnamed protein product [Heterobilharzia americana]|nr:unnamed protein product [Heterobilharzia americana]
MQYKKGEQLHELTISLIHTVILPPCELFSESNAVAFIRKYYKNKPNKYKAFILPDKVVLINKNPKLNVYSKPCIIYSEVKHVFTTPSIPERGVFTLCIDSRSEKQCRYELYKIKDAVLLNSFMDLLNRVTTAKTGINATPSVASIREGWICINQKLVGPVMCLVLLKMIQNPCSVTQPLVRAHQ